MVTATYTIKAEKDGLRDLAIHLEAGRLYAYTTKGPVRHDVEIVGGASPQMQMVSLSSLGKGQTYTASFTVKVPKVSLKDLAGVEEWPSTRPIVATWTTFKMPDGKMSYDSKLGTLGGKTEETSFYYTKGSFFADLYKDSDERPSEVNFYLHYWGPSDMTHEDEMDWIRNLEKVRKALDLPEDVEARSVCVHLWDQVMEAAKKDKVSQDVGISRMANEVRGIGSKERLSNLEAAKKYLRLQSSPSPKLKP